MGRGGSDKAADDAFDEVIDSGRVITGPNRDYTVKVDAQGLQPGSRYHYRFSSGDALSPTGTALTLPGSGADKVTLAVVSCSNHAAGFFNVYNEVAEGEQDVVLHLGDYIYVY